jgi:hypothetical protein
MKLYISLPIHVGQKVIVHYGVMGGKEYCSGLLFHIARSFKALDQSM